LLLRESGSRSTSSIDAAFAAMTKQRADAVIVQRVLNASAWYTGNLAVRHHLPSLSVTKQFAQSGGLMSYSGSFTDIYRRAASYVDRILKGPNPLTCPSSSQRSSSW
jgi:putative ABC transport system substrate-binding protein